MPNKAKKKIAWRLSSIIGAALGLVLYFYAPLVEAPFYLFTTNIDPVSKKIYAQPIEKVRSSWLDRLSRDFHDNLNFAALELASIQNTANPLIKVVHIPNGMRKEQIAEKVGRALGWDTQNKKDFLNAPPPIPVGQLKDGYFYPGFYSFKKGTGGLEAAREMIERFQKEIVDRYPPSTGELVPLATAIKVASLIEREAGGHEDMFSISGVIWNRLFVDMPLGIDATLQYIRGTTTNRWWPAVKSTDKFIKSNYNTYKKIGLPPGPIANPGMASIEAALNPIQTDCFYYLHDKNGKFHCSRTYEEHKENIKNSY